MIFTSEQRYNMAVSIDLSKGLRTIFKWRFDINIGNLCNHFEVDSVFSAFSSLFSFI